MTNLPFYFIASSLFMIASALFENKDNIGKWVCAYVGLFILILTTVSFIIVTLGK